MSNNEVKEYLKSKYDCDVVDATYRKFKANLNLTKSDFLETLLDEIIVMKSSGATDTRAFNCQNRTFLAIINIPISN